MSEPSKNDALQTLRYAFDDTNDAFKFFDIGNAVKVAWDYVAATYPSATQEVYTFKSGGSGGTTVATVTVNYTDSTKASILNAAVT